MTLRALLLAALLLTALMPAASASGGLDLAATSSALQEGDLRYRVEYALSSDAVRSLRLTTRVESGGQSYDHTATWSLGGTSTRTAEGSAGPVAAGDTPFSISFALSPGVPTGEYRLLAFVREAQDPGDSGATLAPAAGESTPVSIVRPAGGGPGTGSPGGGGGGGGDAVGAVAGLTATSITDRGLTLQWEAVAGTGVTYRVHRSQEGGFEPGPANLVAAPALPRATFTGLQPDTLYHVRVRAVDGAGTPGPLSPELTVRTLAGRDESPPGAVAGLRLAKATDHSLALAWEAAQDDRGPLSYEVHRGAPGFALGPGSRVATTTAVAYTDASVASATAYAYRVRAVDGAGNAGPPSAELAASTLPGPADDTLAPAIQRLAFVGSSGAWRLTWATDEPATGDLVLTGPDGAGTRTLAHARSTSSSLTLGELPVGLHAFTLTATDAFGRAGVRSGEFRVEAGAAGRFEALAEEQAAAVAQALSPGAPAAWSLYWADGDADGRVDAVAEARDAVLLRHAMPRQGAFLLQGPAAAGGSSGSGGPGGPTLALAWTDGRVEPVAQAAAEAGATSSSEAVRAVAMHVDGDAGWVAAALADPHGGLPLLAVKREDGTELAAEAWWRDGGKVWVLEGPAAAPASVTYSLLYDNAATVTGGSGSAGGAGPGGGLPAWVPWVAAGLGGLLLGVLLTAFALRRRG